MDPVPTPVRNPTYLEPFEFERNFELHKWRSWFSRNWTLFVHLGFVYVLLIQIGTWWMKNRRPYKLQFLLTVWNIGLAFFSLAGFLRSAPEMLFIYQTRSNPFFQLVCSRQDGNIVSAYWAWVGTFSKAIELGDTAFIVLRKTPLIFLHWYHHVTVMLYTSYTYEAQDPCHRFFIVMNYFVHSVMYSYYALRALGIKVPRLISMVITSLQLLQMIFGCALNAYSYYILKTGAGVDCARLEHNVIIATVMYVSYLVLFAHFFYKTYVVKGGKSHVATTGLEYKNKGHSKMTNGTANGVKAKAN